MTTGGNPLLSFEERIALREQISKARRLRACTEDGSRGRAGMPSGSRMTSSEVESAYRRHLAGTSVRDLASDLWRTYQFATPKSCGQSLALAFKRIEEGQQRAA